jgi:hypothetical protein
VRLTRRVNNNSREEGETIHMAVMIRAGGRRIRYQDARMGGIIPAGWRMEDLTFR